jgi:hypothetical protein
LGTSGLTSGDGKRGGAPAPALAPILDSTNYYTGPSAQSHNLVFPVEWGGAITGPLGVSPRGRIYNITITDPVDVEIIDADLELSPGRY